MKNRTQKQKVKTPPAVPPVPILKAIARLRNLSRERIAEAAEISKPSVTLYLNDPLAMTGRLRARMAKILEIPEETMDDIVNGRITSIDELLTI